jgi:HEAT repeat protein
VDHQVSQLNQLLGQQKYEPAVGVLVKYVPRISATEARASAIWALGMILDGKKIDAALATAIEARLNDIRSIPPEMTPVRLMSAVTLGRIKAKSALASLRNFSTSRMPNPVRDACSWAIQRITGEAMPPPATVRRIRNDWFLSPIVSPSE